MVIGNPPYVRIQRIEHGQSDYFFKRYETPASKTDLSLLFMERGLSLASSNGLVGLICTSQWMATDYGVKMRRALSDGRLHHVVDFGSLPVFPKASTYPAIFVLSPRKAKCLDLKRITSAAQLNLAAVEAAPGQRIPLGSLSESAWSLGRLDIPSLLGRRRIPWAPLRQFGQAFIGDLTGMDAAFVMPREEAKNRKLEGSLLLPYAYRGVEVERYRNVEPRAVVIYPYAEAPDGSATLIPEQELRRKCPRIHKHLGAFKDKLRKRQDSRKPYATGAAWYRHLRAGSFNYIRPAKLVIKGIDRRTTVGVMHGNTVFNGANCPGIIVDDSAGHSPRYILGLLNSHLCSYYLRGVCPAKLGGYSRFNANSVNSTPIRCIDFSKPQEKAKHDRTVTLVRRMLDLHKKLPKTKDRQARTLIERDIAATDRRIDALVYDLYGLTKKEIKIVEEATANA